MKQILIRFCYMLTTTDGINTTVVFKSFYFRNVIPFSQLTLELYLYNETERYLKNKNSKSLIAR